MRILIKSRNKETSKQRYIFAHVSNHVPSLILQSRMSKCLELFYAPLPAATKTFPQTLYSRKQPNRSKHTRTSHHPYPLFAAITNLQVCQTLFVSSDFLGIQMNKACLPANICTVCLLYANAMTECNQKTIDKQLLHSFGASIPASAWTQRKGAIAWTASNMCLLNSLH